MVAVINKPLPQTVGRSSEAEYFKLRIELAQVLNHLAVAGVFVKRYAMALIDDQQGKISVVKTR